MTIQVHYPSDNLGHGYGNYKLTTNPSISRGDTLLVSNYDVSGITGEKYISYVVVRSLDLLNDPANVDLYLFLNETPSSDSLSSARIYGLMPSEQYYLGNNSAGYYLNQMMQTITSSYVTIQTDGVAYDGGTLYDLSALSLEMANHSDRSSITIPQDFYFIVRADVTQNTGLSADRDEYHSTKSSVAAADRARFEIDVPTSYTLDPASLESSSQVHDAAPGKGIGKPDGTDAEVNWFCPSLWREVDQYLLQSTQNFGGYFTDITGVFDDNSNAERWSVTRGVSNSPVQFQPNGTVNFGTAAGEMRRVSMFSKEIVNSRDDWSFSWHMRMDNTQLTSVLIAGDYGFPGTTAHRGWTVSVSGYAGTSGDPDVFNISLNWVNQSTVNKSLTFSNRMWNGSTYVYASTGSPGYSHGGENHWAITVRDKSFFKFFCNGEEQYCTNEPFSSDLSQEYEYSSGQEIDIKEGAFSTRYLGAASSASGFTQFEGMLDDWRAYQKTLSVGEVESLGNRAVFGIKGTALPSPASAQSLSEASMTSVGLHNLRLIGSESQSEASDTPAGIAAEANAESLQAEAKCSSVDLPVPATLDSVESSPQSSQASLDVLFELFVDGSQANVQNKATRIDISGAANAEDTESLSEASSLVVGVDRVGEGVGGETCWVSPSRDNDNEDTADTENFVDGQGNLNVYGPVLWVDDVGDGGDHAFKITTTQRLVNLPGDIF